MAAASIRDVVESVTWFRPDLVLVDLPYDHLPVLVLAGRLRAARERNGGKPWLVALTEHAHEHCEADTLRAGFDVQIAEPIAPETFERALVRRVRTPT